MTQILFYAVRAPYGEFSNFSPHPFVSNGVRYKTSEHYFQAHKFAHSPDDFNDVVNARYPRDAAKIGRDRSRPLRADWEQVKDNVMRDALTAKFDAHPELKKLLLSTGDAEIVENTTYDYYWGWGAKRTGRNMLGILLMELREKIRAESN